MEPIEVAVAVGDESVSGLWLRRRSQGSTCSPTAPAGMTHRSMAAAAEGLAARGIATLRYQFLYMAKGAKRPDPPRLAQAVVRAAAEAARLAPDLPLIAGGRSFGGRMTSQAQAEAPLPACAAWRSWGPAASAGKPGVARAEHLARVRSRCCSSPAATPWRS